MELADGRVLFVKHGAEARAGFYAAEAAGLAWLGEGTLPVPAVVGRGRRLPRAGVGRAAAPRAAGFEPALGRGLAALHALGAPGSACRRPTWIGTLRAPRLDAEDWPSFYGTQRLAPLLRHAADAARCPGRAGRVERVIERLGELCGPAEPPARLHGDLWSGNVMGGPDGAPWLVDPAAYGGHREIDLAMLRALRRARRGVLRRLRRGVAARRRARASASPLYQLLPLLVHAALFGGGYGASADRAARAYLQEGP